MTDKFKSGERRTVKKAINNFDQIKACAVRVFAHLFSSIS